MATPESGSNTINDIINTQKQQPLINTSASPIPASLKPYLGKWKGQGKGFFPGIISFEYSETIEFEPIPHRPVVFYRQKTLNSKNGMSMHGESGYLRCLPDGTLELVIAQSTGLVTIEKGTIEKTTGTLTLKSGTRNFIRSEFAKQPHVKEYTRTFKIKRTHVGHQNQDHFASQDLSASTPNSSLEHQKTELDENHGQIVEGLSYQLCIATDEKPLQLHLEAQFGRHNEL